MTSYTTSDAMSTVELLGSGYSTRQAAQVVRTANLHAGSRSPGGTITGSLSATMSRPAPERSVTSTASPQASQ